MRRLLSILFVLTLTFGLLPVGVAVAGPPDEDPNPDDFVHVYTPENRKKAPDKGRLMVALDGEVTGERLEEIGSFGKVHLVIDRYRVVAVTPKGPQGQKAIEGLSYVDFVEKDQPRYLTDFGTWDRDILDVTDVEESGSIGDPDPREVDYTGDGVTVAVIDTGLPKNWRTFLDAGRVNTDLAKAFMGGGATAEDFVPVDEYNLSNPNGMWQKDTNGHGMAVASHVIGFKIGGGYADGTATGAEVIPLKVFPNGQAFTWSSRIIGAISYATHLKEAGHVDKLVINLSLGGSAPGALDRIAINDAIDAGVIVVASAGNAGEAGMGWPGAYPEVISAGATGWTEQFRPGDAKTPNTAFWLTQDVGNDPDGTGTSEELQSYVVYFSSREIPELGTNFGIDPQELDVLAPGLWTVAPYGHGPNAGYFFLGGTSFSSPLTAGVAALMLEADSSLKQADVEDAVKSTALSMNANGSREDVLDPFIFGGEYDPAWDTDCNGLTCDPVGAGLLQADAALDAVTSP